MSSFLLGELGKKTLETIEKLDRRSEELNIEPLPLRRDSRPMSDLFKNRLFEEAEKREAQTKLREVRGWLERREINPKYRRAKDYRINCGSCAFALWRRLSGADLDAEATRTNVASEIEEMEMITGLKLKNTSPEEIEQILRDRGPGSHLIIGISRFDRPGHWFNAYYDGEKVWTLDGQKGKIWEWPHNYGDIKSWEVLL